MEEFLLFILILICILLPVALIWVWWVQIPKFSTYKNEADKFISNLNFSITKRIIIDFYSPTKLEFLADNENKKFAILSCKPTKNIVTGAECISQENFSVNIFNFSDMTNFELLQESDEVLQGKTLASTAGALLFGATGAIIGSSGQKKILKTNRSIILNIYLNKIDCPVITINFPTIITDSNFKIGEIQTGYDFALKQAQEIKGILTYIQQQNNGLKTNIEENNIATKIKQLNELKEQGLISEEEFSNKKKELLDNL